MHKYNVTYKNYYKDISDKPKVFKLVYTATPQMHMKNTKTVWYQHNISNK